MPETSMRLHLDEGGAAPVAAADREASALTPAPAPQPPASRTPVAFGLTPRTIDEAWRFAQMLANSDMVPKDYRGKPENAMVAMQYGAEVGLPPMAALQSIAVINGKPGLYGDGFLAVIVATPAYAAHQESYLVGGEERERVTAADLTKDDTAALARFWRKGRTEPFTATFSVADAKKARLFGKDGPWTDYPARMLRYRAREFAARDGFAAELRGMNMAEALRDQSDPPTIIPIGAPQRRSLGPPAEGYQPHPAPPGPPPPGGRVAVTPARTVAAEPTPSPDPPTPTPPTRPAASASTTQTPCLIEHTSVVQLKGGLDYEIKAMETGGDERLPPPTHVFVTADEALYQLAASCEGTGALMVATWTRGKSRTGSIVKILTGLAAAD
jgi:hypothetical protein